MDYTSTKTERPTSSPSWLRAIQNKVRSWSQEDPASILLTAILCAFAIFIVSTMAIIQRRAYSALPWGDMWDYWIWYLKPHPNLLVKLFALHNEHRIVVARLFFLADHLLFQGRAIFIFVSIFVIQFCHAILLWRLAYLAHPHRRALSVFVGSTAFVCLFSAEQYTNFTWSFQIQFVAVYFAVTGALASLMVFARLWNEQAVANERRLRIWMAVTILIGIIATYSMANGLLVWPMLLLEAFWFGLPRRTKLTLLVASVVMWALYLWGYHSPPQTSSLREGFHHLPQSFAFAMCALGSPLNAVITEADKIFLIGGEKWQLIWTAVAGLVGLTAAVFLVITFLSIRREATRADGVILHLLVFLLATTFLIGLGRANFPLHDALQSRYATPALLFWFCILFLCSSLVARTARARHGQSFPLFEVASAMVVFLVIVLYQPTQIRYARDAALYVSESEAAMIAPAYDEEIWGRNYYNPRALIPAVRYLETQHLSIFAPERERWLGQPITEHFHPAAPEDCAGYLDDVRAEPDPEIPGLRLRGWAWNPQSRRIASGLVLTDKQDRILGFGYIGFDRPDVQADQATIGRAVGWTAFIPGLSHDFVAAYMVTGHGATCLLGTREFAPLSDVPFQQLGDALPNIPVSIQGGWIKDGYYPGSAPPPISTTVMGSWLKGDGDVGTIRLGPFPTGNADTIALPLVTGPDTKGLSVVVRDSRTGDTVATLSPPVLLKWLAWRIPLPRHNMQLEIVAQDQGRQWGEWMAVGMPHQVK